MVLDEWRGEIEAWVIGKKDIKKYRANKWTETEYGSR
jgi:hypothetical protein